MKKLLLLALSLVLSISLSAKEKKNGQALVRKKIAAARYAPEGMYMKDHYLFFHNSKWHLFAPLGKIGTMWHYEGSEESSELMTSKDLLNWEYIGTAVAASRKEGHFDRLMGGIAPCVIEHDGMFYMIYSGWDFKSKNPRNFEGFRQGVGIAVSRDLVNWEKPEKNARDGIGAHGSDPFIVKDEENNRWLLFTTRSGAVAVYTGTDLYNWKEEGMTLDEKDLKVGMTGMNPAESPFIMKHPKSGKWMILMNGGYAVSDNPLDFPAITPYPFKSGIYTFPEPRNEGKGTFYYAEDDGTGFAHEMIEFRGQWYMTGAVGVDGHTKLKLTPVEWTDEGFRLTPLTREANVERWKVFETSWESEKTYTNPFTDVEVNAVFVKGESSWTMPAFWDGGNKWTVRFAPPEEGEYRYHVECSDGRNKDLNGEWQSLTVTAYTGGNALLKHGFPGISSNGRYFEHADGTPFFWLGDTWWKNLCGRMTWEGFRELTADRSSKGFTLVQIVCGPYPDEGMLEPRWGNEGGLPYEDTGLSKMNPEYFRYADRRIFHLAESGIVPAIVGGWGREQAGGKSTIAIAGTDAYKRHWRHLVSRYGALPVVWIVGGEAGDWQGPWSEVAAYLKEIDPYDHPMTYHSPGHPRKTLADNGMFDFDMVAIGHDGYNTAKGTLDIVKSCTGEANARPVLCGEACYEGHMQTNFQNIQRHLFWTLMLSGAAGHTYGAAGVWHASVEGDPGITPVYDFTLWKEGMNYPGSDQLGTGKKLLEEYQWWKFEQHPGWTDSLCFAAGIPGKVRVIYIPQRNIYNWEGVGIYGLEQDIEWHAYYFDPATGRRFDQGTFTGIREFRKNVPSPQDWVLVLETKQ